MHRGSRTHLFAYSRASISIRDMVGNIDALDCAVADENNALLNALPAGDPVEVESILYDIDNEREGE